MGSEVKPTDEQKAILGHPLDQHGRVLAGPGTGKSFTATLLMGQLVSADGEFRCKMLTFTRAATAEFGAKLEEHGLVDHVDRPATVHSHALSILLGMDGHPLPQPIRIADSWESRRLVQPQISRIMRRNKWTNATPGLVRALEGEMAAGWASMTPGKVLISKVQPNLRAAYVGVWRSHRERLGYTLLAELTYQAGRALEDTGGDNPPAVDLLIVDEYQDLNRADIAFVQAQAALGVRVLAIGDDDQSIYGWRHADPSGIREFPEEFATSQEYQLTLSRRCARRIVSVANELIASAPDRVKKPDLSCGDDNPEGVFEYLRFKSGKAEASAIAMIAAARVESGVDPSDILILVPTRADIWRKTLQPEMESAGLLLASLDWVEDALEDRCLRSLIALARLSVDATDSLAWMGLVQGLAKGVGPTFSDAVLDACGPGERWGECLLRLHSEGLKGFGPAVRRAVNTVVDATQKRLEMLPDALSEFDVKRPTEPWSAWLVEEGNAAWAEALGVGSLGEDAVRLIELVGPKVDRDSGLAGVVNQLEPLGRDLAADEAGGVRLMPISRSKGLTVDTCFVLGLERDLIPLGSAEDDEEQRRLLYVALTRARRVCIATMARYRSGPLARSGGGKALAQRHRSPLVADLSFGMPLNGDNFVEEEMGRIASA